MPNEKQQDSTAPVPQRAMGSRPADLALRVVEDLAPFAALAEMDGSGEGTHLDTYALAALRRVYLTARDAWSAAVRGGAQ